MSRDDELERAQSELANAYRLFNATDDPRLIDEAILRIRSAEMRLDYLTHPTPSAVEEFRTLPWLDPDDPGHRSIF
jgi:hypothetical protein